MYHPSHFKEHDKKILLQFMSEHPFAFITGNNANSQLVATQIPLMIEERSEGLFLQGHLMRQTDHHKAFLENPKVLTVFTGPHTYVSATWYSNPHMGSTWNYMSVHVRGNIRFMNDEELISLMKKFTLKHEQGDHGSPTIFDNLPDSYTSKMLTGIVGFEIMAEDLQHVFKLSQNRDEESYCNIIHQLELKTELGPSASIAKEMRSRMQQLFPDSKK